MTVKGEERLPLMNGVHHLQRNLENALYMENLTPGITIGLGRLTLLLTQVSLMKTPLQQLSLIQAPLSSIMLNRELPEKLLMLPLLL